MKCAWLFINSPFIRSLIIDDIVYPCKAFLLQINTHSVSVSLSGSVGPLPTRFSSNSVFAIAMMSSSHNIPWRDEQPLDRSSVTSNMFDHQATSWFAAGSRLDQRIVPRAATFKCSPHQSLEFLILVVQYFYQGYFALCDKPASPTLAWKSELITLCDWPHM